MISANLGFTLTPGNNNAAGKEDIEQQVLEARKAIVAERFSMENEFNIAGERITETYSFYELVKSSYKDIVLVYEEARVLAEYGERTPLELQQIEWDMLSAK